MDRESDRACVGVKYEISFRSETNADSSYHHHHHSMPTMTMMMDGFMHACMQAKSKTASIVAERLDRREPGIWDEDVDTRRGLARSVMLTLESLARSDKDTPSLRSEVRAVEGLGDDRGSAWNISIYPYIHHYHHHHHACIT